MSNYRFIVSSSVAVLSDKDCDQSSAIPCSLSVLRDCPKCDSHTLRSTEKPLTAVLKLNSELSTPIDRVPAYNVQCIHVRVYCVAIRSIRIGGKI